MGRGLVLTHEVARGYASFELSGSAAELRALAAQVRARHRHDAPPIEVVERGDLLAAEPLSPGGARISGDAEALEGLASVLDRISAAPGQHQHVPLYGEDGVERGEIRVFVG